MATDCLVDGVRKSNAFDQVGLMILQYARLEKWGIGDIPAVESNACWPSVMPVS